MTLTERIANRRGRLSAAFAEQLLEAALADYLAGHELPAIATLEARLAYLLTPLGPTLCTPPWALDPAAAEQLRGAVAEVGLAAGAPLECLWHLETDFEAMRFHSPRLAFVGTPDKCQVPPAAFSPGGLILHQHPGDGSAVPSHADNQAALEALRIEPTIGFAVANANATRLTVMHPPRAPSPAYPSARVFRAGRLTVIYSPRP